MKTLVIFNDHYEDEIKLFVVEGDYSHLHNVYFGLGDELEEELSQLISDLTPLDPQLAAEARCERFITCGRVL